MPSLFLAFEFDELAFKFHGFATGLVFEPHTTLSAYNNKSITQISKFLAQDNYFPAF